MELLNYRKYVVENISLYPSYSAQAVVAAEAADPSGRPSVVESQLAHHQVMSLRIFAWARRVGVQIGAQGAEVGEVATIDGAADGIAELLVVATELLLLGG